MSQSYPHARDVLAARIVQLHGTQRRLSDLLGISRQLLLQRQKVACETETVHPWWCNLLIMESSWLNEPPAGWPIPSPMLVMAAVELNQRTYDQYRRVRGPKKQVKP